MTTGQGQRRERSSTNRDKPRGKLEALARRKRGFGFSFTPHALFRLSRQLGLKPLDLLVLLAILSHAGIEYTDFACASFEQLSKDTGLDRKTVIRHVNQLRNLKLLASTNKRKPDKTQTTNVYNVQLLAERLNTLEGKAPEPERDDVDAIVAEMMAEVDSDEPEDENPAPPAKPMKRARRWASREKDDDGDAGDGRRADEERPAAVPRRSRIVTEQEPAPSPQEATPSSPWQPGSSRLRPAELDDADRAQLDKGERLRHPDERELTVDEHLYRMRELACYSREDMGNTLFDLGFPGEDITAAMNADPVERLARLSGATPVQAPPTAVPVPPAVPDDPELREALKAIESAQRRRRELEKKRES